MRPLDIIIAAGYIGPYSEWSWINILAVIGIGIILFWIVYKAFLCKLDRPLAKTKSVKKVNKVVEPREVIPNSEGIMPIQTLEEDLIADEMIVMPMRGELMEIGKVPEPTFSEKMVGDGFAIKPCSGDIYSPVNGYIKEIGPNKASITFNTLAGRDVILHIGLSVSHLFNGGISLEIKEGNQVKAGDHIGVIDLEQITLGTCSTISPVVFTKLKENEHIVVKEQGLVEAKMKGLVVIRIDRY